MKVDFDDGNETNDKNDKKDIYFKENKSNNSIKIQDDNFLEELIQKDIHLLNIIHNSKDLDEKNIKSEYNNLNIKNEDNILNEKISQMEYNFKNTKENVNLANNQFTKSSTESTFNIKNNKNTKSVRLNDINVITTKPNDDSENYKLSEIYYNNDSIDKQHLNEVIKSQLKGENSDDIIAFTNFKIA